MKYGKVCLILLTLTVLSAELSFAVELQMLVVGHGYVKGEEFSCIDNCTKSYEKGTVVHFKALPFPDSRFAGWKVNGAPHEGVITLDEDTVLSAVFERTNDPMLEDGITVYWYDGNGGRDYAKIGLKEMFIQLKNLEEYGLSTDAEYKAALEEIRQIFHPQAKIGAGDPTLLLVESPEPREKEQWFNTLMTLQELPYVRWAGPILYRDPEVKWTQLMVWDTIDVKFPQGYTEDQIQTIEEEYGLVRLRASSTIPNGFTYQAESPLEAIETANRLYESGLVEWSLPNIPMNSAPLSEPNDKLFNKQWHLKNITQVGEDLNIFPAWETLKGPGIVIAIVDDGVELAHEDFAPVEDENAHRDVLDGEIEIL